MKKNELYEILKEGLKTLADVPEEAYVELDRLFNTNAPAKVITDKGMDILEEMSKDKEAIYTAKSLGEAMGLNSRSVSGSMRKLVNVGLVDKIGQNPTQYKLNDEFEERYLILKDA